MKGEVMPTVALHVRTMVLAGHRIEISAPELPEGQAATVFVVLDEADCVKRPLQDVLGEYHGGQLFTTAEEVDAYLRSERESWDR
jgi:hypothetical protein